MLAPPPTQLRINLKFCLSLFATSDLEREGDNVTPLAGSAMFIVFRVSRPERGFIKHADRKSQTTNPVGRTGKTYRLGC